MKTIKIELNDNDTLSFACAKSCLSAAATYAEENGLVIVGKRDKTGKVLYWFEKRSRHERNHF